MLHKITDILIAYGAWGVLVLSLLESSGVPIPSGVDFLLLGVAASSVKQPYLAYFSALLAVLGSTAGNFILFSGARHGRKMFGKTDAPAGKFRKWYHRYGLLTVFIPAVTPIVPLPLKVFVISAGAFHSPLSRFLTVILVARTIRYFGEAWLGLQLGEDAKGFLIRNGWTLAGVALGLTFALLLLMKLNDRRRQGLTVGPAENEQMGRR